MKLRRAFTLIEASISVAIVGVLLTASAGTFSSIARSQRIASERREAYVLAEQLMNEILQQQFADPSGSTTLGPDAGELRPSFDDVDDYNGYTSTPPKNYAGTALSNYTGWTESVAIAYVDPTNPATVVSTSTLKRITVTITAPSLVQYSLVGLRSKFGAYEAVPLQQTNYVTGVSITLKTGSASKTIYTNAHPLNVSTSQ